MHSRRWWIVGVCFCAFTGCVACQSSYDYCGPMPEEGGDFLYRKNSILGGDPSKPPVGEEGAAVSEGQSDEDIGPEPTPAPAPDEEPTPGIEFDDSPTGPEPEMAPEEGSGDADEPQASEDAADGAEQSAATLEWHAPAGKGGTSPIRQVRFRGE